ncbi:MAG: hypothetical protein QGF59_13315 [Pirellulaceae bacterium]|nr:hypothetical protein [Pirellulaceae bacterium]MDP6719632.1 hypothetical protein [Pirellulaceae bacterium]
MNHNEGLGARRPRQGATSPGQLIVSSRHPSRPSSKIAGKLYPQKRADCKNYNDCTKLVGKIVSAALRKLAEKHDFPTFRSESPEAARESHQRGMRRCAFVARQAFQEETGERP